MVRSIESWMRLLQGKTDLEIAKYMIEDLVGYRSTSLHRADDIDALRNAVKAIRQMKET